jgi:hypothetical protein
MKGQRNSHKKAEAVVDVINRLTHKRMSPLQSWQAIIIVPVCCGIVEKIKVHSEW